MQKSLLFQNINISQNTWETKDRKNSRFYVLRSIFHRDTGLKNVSVFYIWLNPNVLEISHVFQLHVYIINRVGLTKSPF